MPKRTADERFEAKVHRAPSGCWLWRGACDPYGNFYGGLAHRWSYERHIGPIPDGMNVCHTCDMPPCVNPAHLFVATQRGNVHDCISKGRHRNGTTGLTETQESAIRSIYEGRFGEVYALARDYGVSGKVIAAIVRGAPRHYGKHLPLAQQRKR